MRSSCCTSTPRARAFAAHTIRPTMSGRRSRLTSSSSPSARRPMKAGTTSTCSCKPAMSRAGTDHRSESLAKTDLDTRTCVAGAAREPSLGAGRPLRARAGRICDASDRLAAGRGRDLDEYLYGYIQFLDWHPLAAVVDAFSHACHADRRGPALDLGGGFFAEPLMAVLFAGSVVAWAAAARAFGARVALLVAAALLVYPAYGLMFHELSSEPVFAAAFAGLGTPRHARRDAAVSAQICVRRPRRCTPCAGPSRERAPARVRRLPVRATGSLAPTH